jgi:hypothetical protein
MTRRERIQRAAREALLAGGEPRLAIRVMQAPEGLPLPDLERRFQALLDTVPEEEDRVRIGLWAWGEDT